MTLLGTERESERRITTLPARLALPGAHVIGAHQLDHFDGRDELVLAMLAGKDARMPNALGFMTRPCRCRSLWIESLTLVPAAN